VVYAAIASVFVLLLAMELPPMQGADEGAHLARADQISRGGLIARRIGPHMSGGTIDSGTMVAINRFYPLSLHGDWRLSRNMFMPIPWGSDTTIGFPNTALYPPLFYVPDAAAICAGKWLGLSVLPTLRLARMMAGLCAVAVSALAISLSGGCGLWLFALLLLPSSAMQMAVISQDGLMLAAAALAAALMLRLQRSALAGGEGAGGWRGELVILSLLLALIAMARPPYAAFVILPLACCAPPARARWAAAGALVLAAAWWAICAIYTVVNVDPTHAANPAAQLILLFKHPWRLVPLTDSTIAKYGDFYTRLFVSPIDMPPGYTGIAWAMLLLAGIATALACQPPRRYTAVLAVAAIAASVAGIFAIQYLTWTPVGFPTIEGVLGRYFLPPAAFLMLCLGAPLPRAGRLSSWLALPVKAFPVLSVVVVVHTLVLRFYF
jgi:uncharacterized membrane protein